MSQITIIENIQNCHSNSKCQQINNGGGGGVILPGIGFIPNSQVGVTPPPVRGGGTPFQPTSQQHILTFYSDGAGAEYAGNWLGEYHFDYQRQIYIQRSTESQSPDYEPRYLFQDSETNKWFIGSSLEDVHLGNQEASATVPTSGWQVWHNDVKAWTSDNTLTVIDNAFRACAPIRIYGYGVPAKRWKSKFGDYQETNRWFNGHPIYQKQGGVDLMKMLNTGDWGIGKRINTYGFAGGPGYRSPTKIKRTSWWSATGRGDGTTQPVKIIARCL